MDIIAPPPPALANCFLDLKKKTKNKHKKQKQKFKKQEQKTKTKIQKTETFVGIL